MKTSLLFTLAFLILSLNAYNQDEHFGHASQETWNHISEVNSDIDLARGVGGLAAGYGLLITDANGEGVIQAATTDDGDYTTVSDFMHSLDILKQSSTRNAIDQLLARDELEGGTLLTDHERSFWEALRNTIDVTGHGSGSTNGEPHISTLDGYLYDLQAAGEFILCKSTNSNFEIQVRQKPWSGNVAVNSAIAMNVHGQKISFYASDFPDDQTSIPLRINGTPYSMRSKFVKLKTGGAVQKLSDHNFIVYWETGEQAAVNISQYMDIVITIPRHTKQNIVGLMGNNNASKEDDLKTSDGIPLEAKSWSEDAMQYINFGKSNQFGSAEKLFNESLSKKFANSWRIAGSNSLFSYPAGESTISFTNKSFPSAYNSVSDLTPEQIEKARKTCQQEGVTDEHMQSCIYDVAFTNQDVFAKTNAYLVKTKDILQKAGITTPLNKVDDINNTKSKLKQKLKNKLLHL